MVDRGRVGIDVGGLIPGEVVVGEFVDDRPGGLAVVDQVEPDEHLSDSAWQMFVDATPPNTKRNYERVLGMGEGDLVADGVDLVDEPRRGTPWHRLGWLPYCTASGRRSGIGDQPAHPHTVAQWVADLAEAGVGVPTIDLGLAAVARLHRSNGHRGHPDTEVARQVLKSYRRGKGAYRVKRVAPVTLPVLRAMIDGLDLTTVKGRRDAAMLVVGVAGMFRRSELVDLALDGVDEDTRGLVLYLGKSKTDKDAIGAEIVIPRSKHKDSPTDPLTLVRGVLADLTEQGITEGKLFRSVDRWGNYRGRLHPNGYDVVRVVKDAAAGGGLNPGGYAGHSLRAGGATAAHLGGASIREIMEQGRWLRPEQVVEYIRLEDRWVQNAAARIGL